MTDRGPAKLLDTLTLPDDLRSLDPPTLRRVAAEVRERIIESIACVGGHLGPSLGVVELTVALHAELESPVDKIVWDVGHQAYAHKLLTGRADRFATIRTFGGLSGFPRPSESEHDAFGTGHSSTSVSVGVGLAEATRRTAGPGRRPHVVAVIGDGALTGGMAYEGLNQAGHLRTPLVVVLNDNEMSIKRNVGAISSYLSRLRTEPHLFRLRRDLERRVQRFPGIGERVYAVGEHVKEGVKAALVPGMLFEELGFQYIGVTDGHDIEALRADIRRALAVEGPVLLHVRTVKGKGYAPAERAPDRFHGTSPFSVSTGECAPDPEGPPTYTEAFGRALVTLARTDKRIVGITAAMAAGTGLDHMEREFPDRFFDVGIAEAHAVGFAAGLATAGLRPVVALYSTFLQRAYDQVIHDVCLPGLPVVFAVDRAGLVGEDGPTHHGAFDLSFLRAVPGMTIFVPTDEAELQLLLATALSMDGPVTVRYPRGRGRGVPLPARLEPLSGPWVAVVSQRDGSLAGETTSGAGHTLRAEIEASEEAAGDLLLLGCGTGVALCESAAALLRPRGVSVTVANVRRVWPLDAPTLVRLVESHRGVVTVEENTLVGGFGSAIAELVMETGLERPLERVGLPDRFVAHGDMDSLRASIGFTAQGVALAGEAALSRAGARTG